jgi:pimeloyl-[acyl-carrier protein] methyl ester esterase
MTQLIFIHGWGFDPYLWDKVAALVPAWPQYRVDLGFFGGGESSLPESSDAILIGHSLGFIWGMHRKQDWRGWIAINSFPRFLPNANGPGCTEAAALRGLRRNLRADPAAALQDFYRFIGAPEQKNTPDKECLMSGLDLLRDMDIAASICTPGLVLASKQDKLVPMAVSENLAATHPDNRLMWHDGSTHLLPYHDPAWCANAIAAYAETRR